MQTEWSFVYFNLIVWMSRWVWRFFSLTFLVSVLVTIMMRFFPTPMCLFWVFSTQLLTAMWMNWTRWDVNCFFLLVTGKKCNKYKKNWTCWASRSNYVNWTHWILHAMYRYWYMYETMTQFSAAHQPPPASIECILIWYGCVFNVYKYMCPVEWNVE